MTKPNLAPASGTRDFLPAEMQVRRRVLATVEQVFQRHGFLPLDTPAFERVETLTGKYGDEGEKLIFKILKRGEQAKTGEVDFALRYDLTVPTMRVIAGNRHLLPRIFKRYQMGPVWRADRPGRGRFREFYQCDVDIVGSPSTLADVEVLLALAAAATAVGLGAFRIKLNSRKVLKGLMEVYGVAEAIQGKVVIALDKLDKIGPEALPAELEAAGLAADAAATLARELTAGDISHLRARLAASPVGAEGLAEVDAIVAGVAPALAEGAGIAFDPLLARGLDYYTGAIFEFVAEGFGGSIAGGGRYDGLTGLFGAKPEPVCGGSLGIERILMLLQEGGAPEPIGPTAYVTVWDQAAQSAALALAGRLRAAGVSAELDLVGGGMRQQLKAASERRARYAILCGPDEQAAGTVVIKDMDAGTQVTVPLDQAVEALAGKA